MTRAAVSSRAVSLVLLAALLAAVPLAADEGIVDPSQMPGPLAEVRFDQHLGETLPLDLPFVDAEGRAVALGDYFGRKPVILVFVYYHCPMLCPLVLDGVAKSLAILKFDVGSDYDVVVVSIDPKETPAQASEALARTVKRYGRPATAPGWHFLTGQEDAIERLTAAAGYRYAYLPDSDEFAHASGIVVVSPEGRIGQYFYGFEYAPKDVRLALVDASSGKVGTVIDQVLLYCFRYDPKLGKYTAVTYRILRISGVLFVVILGIAIWLMSRRDPASKHPKTSPAGAA